jgi:hypothetical protein
MPGRIRDSFIITNKTSNSWNLLSTIHPLSIILVAVSIFTQSDMHTSSRDWISKDPGDEFFKLIYRIKA